MRAESKKTRKGKESLRTEERYSSLVSQDQQPMTPRTIANTLVHQQMPDQAQILSKRSQIAYLESVMMHLADFSSHSFYSCLIAWLLVDPWWHVE